MSDHDGAAKRPKPYLRQELDPSDSAQMKPEPYLRQPTPVEAED